MGFDRWEAAIRVGFVATVAAGERPLVCMSLNFADRKYDQNLAFGQVKYIGALWMAHLARRYPDLRIITVSPGNTTGTAVGAAPPLHHLTQTRQERP